MRRASGIDDAGLRRSPEGGRCHRSVSTRMKRPLLDPHPVSGIARPEPIFTLAPHSLGRLFERLR
jgi:hypothetical protein